MYKGSLINSGGNAKTIKGDKLSNFETAIMYLASASQSGMGNVCPMAIMAGCEKPCLMTAGRAGLFVSIINARVNKTRRYFSDRAAFMAELVRDLEKFERYCARRSVKPACRLNGTSDIQFEIGHAVVRKGRTFPSIFAAFPRVKFYDYTKIMKRAYRELPRNYSLTLSYSGANPDYAKSVAKTAHETGANVAIVFRTKAMRNSHMYSVCYAGVAGMERKVIDGDKTDMRFADPKNVIVGLYAKGRAKKDTSGFVID